MSLQAEGVHDGGGGGGGGGSGGKDLDEEVWHIRDLYAKKIAKQELRYERMMKDKDDACEEWYKTQAGEIKKYQKSLWVMQGIFRKRQHRYAELMEAEKAEFAAQRAAFNAATEQLQEEYRKERLNMEKRLEEEVGNFEKLIKDQRSRNKELKEKAAQLGRQLDEKTAQVHSFAANMPRAIAQVEEDLRTAVAEQRQTLQKNAATISGLQDQAFKLNKAFTERDYREADALRKELMRHAAFLKNVERKSQLQESGTTSGVTLPELPTPRSAR